MSSMRIYSWYICLVTEILFFLYLYVFVQQTAMRILLHRGLNQILDRYIEPRAWYTKFQGTPVKQNSLLVKFVDIRLLQKYTFFFILGDPKNNFSTEKIPQNFQLLEGHTLILLKLFESSCIVLKISRVDSAQKCPFWTCQTPEQLLRSKSCRSMTPILPISVAVTKYPILIYIFEKFILHIKRDG